MNNNKFSIISSMTKTNRGIGFMNKLPWKTTKEGKEDLAFFSYLTSEVKRSESINNTVIMGRKTWESLPKSKKPLPKRTNIILTRNSQFDVSSFPIGSVLVANSLDNALTKSQGNVFVIGGEDIFKQALEHPQCQKIYLSVIDDSPNSYKCDTFFPTIPDTYK